MMNLSGVGLAVDALARPAVLRRFDKAGAWVDGVFDETIGSSDTDIMAVIQSPSEKDMRLVPEGERVEAYVTIWSRTEMKTSDETGGRADIIVGQDGEAYRVVRKANRTEGGYCRVIARLERHDAARNL